MDAISFAGVVLAGGRSRRLGLDKAGLILPGQQNTLLEKALQLLKKLTPEVYVSGRELPGQNSLPDLPMGEAALRGVYSALKILQKPCLIIACDMPCLDETMLRPLLVQPCPGMTLYVHEGWFEPLCALYDPCLLPLLEKAAREGNYSLRKIIPREMMRALPCPPEFLPRLANINTPEDLAALAK